jgi:phosphatidate cytidylyltransferase
MVANDYNPLLWAWGGIAGLLMAASAVVEVVLCFHPSPEALQNRRRIHTWWLISLSVFVAMSIGVIGLNILFCTVSILALKEFAVLSFHGKNSRIACGVMTVGTMLLYAFLMMRSTRVPFGMALCVGCPALALGVFVATRSIKDSLLSCFAFLFSAVGLSHVILFAKLPASGDAGRFTGAGALFFLLLMTALNDIAQYLWGKGLGRRKVVPRISPNKTLAGLIGGVSTTTVLSVFIAGILTSMRWPVSAGAGLIIGFGGFLGDIIVSAYKRGVGVKDSGHFLPGHGGMLDRVDSLCLTAPLLYWFVTWI